MLRPKAEKKQPVKSRYWYNRVPEHLKLCIGSSSKSAFEVAAAIVLPFLLLLER
uniref:HDC07781 n=1 Tax=Drosophila melanogaster TaxID=7227 RepID=Q6IM18_DROME|nr:TPA_inf: HDC07781 [Drosophila melanogaster]